MHPGVQHAIMKIQVDLAEMRADLMELRTGLDREHYVESRSQTGQRNEPEVEFVRKIYDHSLPITLHHAFPTSFFKKKLAHFQC
jgi:hypothetical protein